MRISYVNKVPTWYVHGGHGSDAGREAKLLHVGVIHELLAAFRRSNLSMKDKFYLAVFALLVPIGRRSNELATLPKDCFIKIGDHHVLIDYPEKGERLHRNGSQMSRSRLSKKLWNILSRLRNQAERSRRLKENPNATAALDWLDIMTDETAAEYSVGKFAHEWSANPQNNLLNTEAHGMKKKSDILM